MSKITYDRHADEWKKVLADKNRKKFGESWISNEHTLDKWRHQRMYGVLEPLVGFKNYSWLTIGDGRYGSDATAIMDMGAKTVHCSDISDTLLKIANAKGIIGEYSEQNAESITFNDDQFDFVLCKEAYHHFPRPQIALHEMLRVCKVGVILIEPRDLEIDAPPLYFLIKLIKWFLGKSKNTYRFETVGNYVYTVSEKEMKKFQLGMHRRYLAFRGLNDVYKEGGEFISINSKKVTEKKVIKNMKLKISILDLLCRLKIIKTNLVVSILFKSEPSKKLLRLLTQKGWAVNPLPKNPYL